MVLTRGERRGEERVRARARVRVRVRVRVRARVRLAKIGSKWSKWPMQLPVKKQQSLGDLTSRIGKQQS